MIFEFKTVDIQIYYTAKVFITTFENKNSNVLYIKIIIRNYNVNKLNEIHLCFHPLSPRWQT